MIIPDPNFFSGDIFISKKNDKWSKINNDKMLLGIPNKTDNDGLRIANYRGIGLSDMVDAIINKRKPRCSLDFSLHVLEVMEKIIQSAETNTPINLTSKIDKPQYLGEDEIENLKK